MQLQAVLTGDIVNSTGLPPVKEKKLVAAIQGLFEEQGYTVEFFRGDSFQALVKDRAKALQLALLCRCAAIRLTDDDKQVPCDVRLAIGTGTVAPPVKRLQHAKGEAFVRSGRCFDTAVKSGQRLAISTGHALADAGLEVLSAYLNTIFENMTGRQAEVLFELLQGLKQKDAAKKLKKTKSTIHQRMVAGRWAETALLLEQYKKITALII